MDDTKSNNDSQIEEAEIVDSNANDNPISDEPNSNVSTLLEIEKAVKMKITALERLKEEAKPIREMLESTLQANLEYAEVLAAASEAAKKKSAKKKELLNNEAGKKIVQKLNELKAAIKENQESLSYFLQEYSRLTGAKEIEGEDGEIRQIVYVAKLVKKSSKFRP